MLIAAQHTRGKVSKNAGLYKVSLCDAESALHGGAVLAAIAETDDWTREVALRALNPAPGATVLVAEGEDGVAGVASYRLDDGIKRVNTASFVKRAGVGSALVAAMLERHPGLPMWTKSDPRANAFCDALGMRRCETLDDGRVVYRWSADEAGEYMRKRRASI